MDVGFRVAKPTDGSPSVRLAPMKTDANVKGVLTLIATLLAAIAVERFVPEHVALAQVSPPRNSVASSAQWEYRRITRTFEYKDGIFHHFDSWDDDGKQLPLPADIDVKLRELGSSGWELVTVTTYALAMKIGLTGQTGSLTNLSGYSQNGAVMADCYVFKRPRR